MRGRMSHQKKYSWGAKTVWSGVPGVRNSVTGRTLKLKTMTRMVAQSAWMNFLLNDSNFISRNSSGMMRKQSIVARRVKTKKILSLATDTDTALMLPST